MMVRWYERSLMVGFTNGVRGRSARAPFVIGADGKGRWHGAPCNFERSRPIHDNCTFVPIQELMPTDVIRRNNVKVSGRGTRPMLFAHGFGCDQQMWRYVAPAFEHDYRVITFDYVGWGGADRSSLR